MFVTPGALPLLAGLTVVQGLAQGSGNQMLRAIVADVADKHRLDTGVDRSALFFSVFSLAAKAAMAVAIGITLPLIAWLRLQSCRQQYARRAARLAMVFAIGPALAHILAAWLVYGFPLDEASHDHIRRALAQRDTAPAVEPPDPAATIS